MRQNGRLPPVHPPHRPLGPTFYRYVAVEALRPTLFALLGLTTVVLTKDLLGFSDLVINRGLGVGAVSLIAFYEAVPIATLIFPLAVLLGCLVAMGRLGADREILSLEASGVAAARLVWPVIVFAAAMSVVAGLLSVRAAPWAIRSLDNALAAVTREKPWTQIRKGTVSEFGGWQLEAREVSSGGDRLRGVLLWVPDIGETVFAQSGRLEAGADGSVQIQLYDGDVVLSPRGGPKEIRFDALTTMLPTNEDLLGIAKSERIKGLSFAELDQQALEFVPSESDSSPRAAIEYQRRIATPAATLVFGFLAAPLFLIRGNYSRAGGGVLGLVLTVIYYGLVQLGQGLIQGGNLDVLSGIWLPNALLATLAIAFLVKALRGNVLGQNFDRPRFSQRVAARWETSAEYRPRRYPLPRYIAGRFIRMSVLTFAVLVVAYLLIDIMERLDWFARYHATGIEVVRFYGARVPLLASRVVPMSLLFATALTVSLLAVEGELIGMRSCGIPAPRALLPVLVLSAFVAPGYFALNDVVVPRTNALADELKVTEIKDENLRKDSEPRKEEVWHRAGDQVLEAERFDPEGGDARELTIYRLGEDGLPVSRVDARAGSYIGKGVWRLTDTSKVEIANGSVRAVTAPRYATLGDALPAEVDTMHLPVAALMKEIEMVEADGYDATAYRVDLQVKIANPLACIILPALVLFFAVGGPPYHGPAQTLLVSAIVGVGYILLTGVSASLGYGGTLPPAIGGWGPNIVFIAVTVFLGVRLWRRL